MARYHFLAVGGTFDHFHLGHQHFLSTAAALTDQLLIGITQDNLTRSKIWPQTIESYQDRHHQVVKFCENQNWSVEIMPLTDIYGPTLTDTSIEALAITPETTAGATQINTRRQEQGLPPLAIHQVDYYLDQAGQPLHAEAIRAGWASRLGVNYPQLLRPGFQLTDQQRQALSHPPAGAQLLTTAPEHSLPVVVVGDNSLETYISQGWRYDVGVFDRRRQRHQWQSSIIDHLQPTAQVANPAGQITPELVASLLKLLQPWQQGSWQLGQPPRHLFIDGEEDLAAVALALLLPLGSHLTYGQPNQGMMRVPITEQLKETFGQILTNHA